jgi:long-subunit fatty acid transport protein
MLPLRLAPPACGALALLALCDAPAASPLEDVSQGGAVFTGVARAHATSIHLNPAALGMSGEGFHIFVGSSTRLDQLWVDRYAIDPATGVASEGEAVGALTATPGGVVAAWSKFGDRFHGGLALHTPFAERFPGGEDALGYHTLGAGHLYSVMLSFGGSIQVDRFLFGIGLSFSNVRMRHEFRRDSALEHGSSAERGIASDCGGAPCGLENPAAAEHYTVRADNYGTSLGGLEFFPDFIDLGKVGLSAGIALEIPNADGWWITLAYLNTAGFLSDIELNGEAAVKEAPRDGSATMRGDAELRFQMPQSFTFGGRGPIMPGWEVIGSLRWLDMSRHNEVDYRFHGGTLDERVPEWYPRFRGLRDTVQAQAGLEMEEGQRLRLGGRIRFESGATTPFTSSPMTMDTHNLALVGGLEWRFGQHLVVGAGYDLTVFWPTDSEASAFDPRGRLDCIDSGYDYYRCEAVRDGHALPSAAGAYRRLRHQLTLGIRWDSL